jgi:membrane protein YdbS with pleckstrin-like domain
MQCPACGVEAVEQAVYCHKCGERLGSAGNELPQNSQPAEQPPSEPTEIFERAASARREAPSELEEELWRGGYSSKAMLGAWVTCGLISVALLVVGILWRPDAAWWLILLALMILPWLYNLAVLGYRRLSVRYRLTTQRFLHESGILRRVNDRIEVLDMDDITFEQGLLERLVGVGTIHIVSSDRTNPNFALPGIENVKTVSELFDDARRAERRLRGLHIEQI